MTVSTASSPLTLTSAPYYVDGGDGAGPSGWDAGQVIKSRVWATSAYVPGGVEVLSVAGMVAATLKVFVYETTGAGWGQLETDLTTLIDAFDQSSYTVTLTIDAATFAWTCADADVQIDGFSRLAVIGLALGVTFDIPRSPVPVSGPI